MALVSAFKQVREELDIEKFPARRGYEPTADGLRSPIAIKEVK